MIEKLNKLIIKTMKAKDKFKTKCLTTLKAELLNNSKSKKPKKDDEVVLNYLKTLQKSAEPIKNNDIYKNMYNNLMNEIEIVKEFTPNIMTDNEVKSIVNEYFRIADKSKVSIGIAIKNLKDSYGVQNSAIIAKYVKKHINNDSSNNS